MHYKSLTVDRPAVTSLLSNKTFSKYLCVCVWGGGVVMVVVVVVCVCCVCGGGGGGVCVHAFCEME